MKDRPSPGDAANRPDAADPDRADHGGPADLADLGNPADPAGLRRALAGVRGLLLDLDGVILLAGRPIPGSVEALRSLEERQVPYRIVTNTSAVSRATLSRWAGSLGVAIPPERFHSALTAAVEDAVRRHPDGPLYVLATDDALTEFAGLPLMSDEAAAAPDARAAAVIVGDAPDRATLADLNRAFRLIRRGAELVGMHRNRWWLTPAGETLDSGAFVVGLAFAAEVRARIAGKPSPVFFRQVAAEIAVEIGTREGGRAAGRVRRSDLAMVGDDVETDVLAAKRAGLRGILVLSGKHGAGDVERVAARRRGGGRPDAVTRSLADVVAALD